MRAFLTDPRRTFKLKLAGGLFGVLSIGLHWWHDMPLMGSRAGWYFLGGMLGALALGLVGAMLAWTVERAYANAARRQGVEELSRRSTVAVAGGLAAFDFGVPIVYTLALFYGPYLPA